MVRVLIADDHTLFREGLKQVLAAADGIEVVGEVATAEELMACLPREECDVLLLDISMPGRSGMDVLADLATLAPGVRIVMLSMHSEEQYAVRALKAGAAGFLCKDSDPEELGAAIRTVAGGERYISSSMAHTLAAYIESGSGHPRHEALSNREFEVLRLLAGGLSNKEIAFRLSISDKTVSTYRARIREKLNLGSTAEIVQYAIQYDLID